MGIDYLSTCDIAEEQGDKSSAVAAKGIRNVINNKLPKFSLEYPCHSNVERRWFTMRVKPLHVTGQRFTLILHERHIADSETRIRQERLALATDAGHIGIWDMDILTHDLTWDHWMFQIYGISPKSFQGTYLDWVSRIHPEDIETATHHLEDSLNTGKPFESEFRIIRPSGELRYITAKAQILKHTDGSPQRIIGVNVDITDRKVAEERVKNLAYFDQLTQLPNRRLFLDQLKEALTDPLMTHQIGALFFIDIDRFKTINDTLGHSAGDALLIQVAKRLTENSIPKSTISRLSGDEFTVLIHAAGQTFEQAHDTCVTLAKKILSSLRQPFSLLNGNHQTTVSIGISLFERCTKGS